MTESQAKRMGFRPVSYWESGRMDAWRRSLRRPVCNEYWSPGMPNRIERVESLGVSAQKITVRGA